MAQAYTPIPQGALFNISEALPQGLLYRYKKISNISRQHMKFPPNNGQGEVWAGQTNNSYVTSKRAGRLKHIHYGF